MRRASAITLAAAAMLVLPHAGYGSNGGTPIKALRVQFAKGADSAVIRGSLQGDSIVDYKVQAGAGQTLAVSLKKSNGRNYFNVNPPGSIEAMYVGQTGEDFKGLLPDDGEYTIRVYLIRAAARRNEASDYTITMAVTGKALAPIPASKDALVPGTRFHAKASVACVPPYGPKPPQCEAFVVRRGHDRTATVEVRAGQEFRRRILFVAGKPVASDATSPLTVSREGDVIMVSAGVERYEIPDAILTGG